MNLTKLETNRSVEVRETLEFMLTRADDLDAVVILGLQKTDGQELRTSNCTGQEKQFMLGFFQAWMAKWFFSEVGN